MPMGLSPVVIRSPAGVKDSTNKGLVAARSRRNLSAFSLPPITFVQARHPLRRGRMLAGIGNYQLSRILRLEQIFQRLWRLRRFDDAGVVDDANDTIAILRADIWVDHFFWK